MKNYIHIAIILFTSNLGWSQLFFNDAIVNIQNGGIMIIKTASLENSNNGSLQNAGQLIIEKDFINNGLTDGLNSNTGLFQIQENWINNNDFNADNSTVELYGNDQLITGTSVTDFYNLNLTGSGVKIMQINSKTEWLDLTSVELNTTNYIMEIHNPDVNAINRTSGFVSSTNDGHLQRWTNSTNDYLFPVGSSIGTFRYRPIIFTPYDNSLNIFGVRLANNNPSNDGYSIIKRDPTVESINNLYYHHLYQNQGNSEANVTFLYDATLDGTPEAIGQWKGNKWIGSTNVNNDYTNLPFASITLLSVNNYNSRAFALANIFESVYIPNAFSPNGDGFNDEFYVGVNPDDVSLFSLEIFNRWGELIFETSSPTEKWDATYKSSLVPNGVYVWKVKYQDKNSLEIKNKIGHVTLIR